MSESSVPVPAEPGTKANPLLSMAQVARRLGFAKKTIGRLRKRGAFPNSQPVGSRIRIPEQDVLMFLRAERERRRA